MQRHWPRASVWSRCSQQWSIRCAANLWKSARFTSFNTGVLTTLLTRHPVVWPFFWPGISWCTSGMPNGPANCCKPCMQMPAFIPVMPWPAKLALTYKGNHVGSRNMPLCSRSGILAAHHRSFSGDIAVKIALPLEKQSHQYWWPW